MLISRTGFILEVWNLHIQFDVSVQELWSRNLPTGSVTNPCIFSNCFCAFEDSSVSNVENKSNLLLKLDDFREVEPLTRSLMDIGEHVTSLTNFSFTLFFTLGIVDKSI